MFKRHCTHGQTLTDAQHEHFIMNRIFLTFIFITFLLFPGQLYGSSKNEQFITLNLPGSVLAQAAAKIVPFDLDISSQALKGSVSINTIDDIQLKNQQISCRLGLIGQNMQLDTEISGHKINLNVGSVQLNFQANARLRFDAKKQMLYIRPVLSNRAGSPPKRGDIANALLAFISGREFPVSIKKLKPLIADTNNKSIIIDMEIHNIEAVNNGLKVSITPTVTNLNLHILKKK